MEVYTRKTENIRYNSCKIIIIGAGIAGLSAANHLVENAECDFLIVEARSRIGGRIFCTNIGNDKIELGANWIHGVLGNPIFELALANDLISIMSIPKPHKIIAATEDGKQIPFSILEEIYAAYLCFLKKCEEYFLSSYSPPEGIQSVGEHITLETNLYLIPLSPKDKKIRKLLFDCLLKRESCITGCDNMGEIDLLEMGSYTELQGGNIAVLKGYSSILEPICRNIPKNQILTEHTIEKIRWQMKTDDSSSDSSSYIKIECNNGKVISCEQVICTLPLGVLKEHAMTIFEPSLTRKKLKAIERLMFGTVDKIVLEYDRPFLNPEISEIMLLWDDQNVSEEDLSDLSKSWFRKIYSFTKLSDTTLLGWISGRAAEFMEGLSCEEVAEVCTDILRIFLNDPLVPAPKTCIRTDWNSQPFTRGSYTSIAVGASQQDIENLAEPLIMPGNSIELKIAFAGEHTHSSFYSTVHGAFLSGRAAAQTILESRRWKRSISLSCNDTSDLSSWIQGIELNR